MKTTPRSRFPWPGHGLAISLAAMFALTACDETGAFSLGTPGTGGEETAGGVTTRTTDKDVEAPEVFQVTANGLWDGRPSLGGVWVAHPDVDTPERVMIRNLDNGQFVIGALFRRISNLPGPPLQLSSDAAVAIGVLAGAPVALDVVALRKEVIEIAPPEEEITSDEAIGDTPNAETEQQTETASEAEKPVAEASEEEPSEADPIAAASAAIEAAEPEAVTQPVEVKETATSVASTEIVSTTLPVSTLKRPWVQAATVSSEENANRAVADLKKTGLNASFKSEGSGDKTLWRVLVGPAATEAERDKILSALQETGFSDAYAVSK